MPPATAPSAPTRPRGYLQVEGLHLRQWVLRAVPILAVAATNGAGWLDLAAFPRHDAPLRYAGLPSGIGTACGIAGAALIALATILRVAAKGVLVRKTTVTTGGAYGLVRHPFYLATLMGAVGVLLLAGPLGGVVAAAWLAVAIPVFLVTIAGEEAGLRSIHGAAWDAYAARVPRLLPTGRLGGDRAPVTWANLVKEGEPPRCLRFLAGATAVLAFRTGGTGGAILVAGAALAFAASHVVARSSRRRAE